MGKQYLRTIKKIFSRPERADIKWREVEGLLVYLGGKMSEGRGSRKRYILNDVPLILHRPHPRKELTKGAVKSLRKFLIDTGLFDENGGKR